MKKKDQAASGAKENEALERARKDYRDAVRKLDRPRRPELELARAVKALRELGDDPTAKLRKIPAGTKPLPEFKEYKNAETAVLDKVLAGNDRIDNEYERFQAAAINVLATGIDLGFDPVPDKHELLKLAMWAKLWQKTGIKRKPSKHDMQLFAASQQAGFRVPWPLRMKPPPPEVLRSGCETSANFEWDRNWIYPPAYHDGSKRIEDAVLGGPMWDPDTLGRPDWWFKFYEYGGQTPYVDLDTNDEIYKTAICDLTVTNVGENMLYTWGWFYHDLDVPEQGEFDITVKSTVIMRAMGNRAQTEPIAHVSQAVATWELVHYHDLIVQHFGPAASPRVPVVPTMLPAEGRDFLVPVLQELYVSSWPQSYQITLYPGTMPTTHGNVLNVEGARSQIERRYLFYGPCRLRILEQPYYRFWIAPEVRSSHPERSTGERYAWVEYRRSDFGCLEWTLRQYPS